MNELDLFATAIAIADPTKRSELLDRECAGRSELRQRLDLLLEAHARSHPLLDPPHPSDVNRTTAYAADPSLIGTVVTGRYKLLEAIGEGGMGTVWMAEQREPVKRLVALKLIKPGMDSRSVLARFEAERQALALMDHPNIARVLDGGTTAEGRPYFVMDLVKGLPLTEYCDARRLSVRDRLEMFGQVCSAVQHAHQKGVIHRDLKPTNVLVTEHDGKPVPKVIDFGLAKALTGSIALTDKTLHTSFGSVVGTPLYMAPEQVGINALDVDTRTDIYALGVMLYELLTGSTPLEKKRLREAAWEEMRRLIREEEPPRPSVRLSSSAGLPSLAAGRQTEPAQLTRLVRGELDWIVMKALEKDRNRRYETANGLAMDVQRHLAGEPVLAVPPSAGYRLRKFVRRNRPQVVAATLILLALLTGIAGTTFGLIRAESSRREAVASAAREADERTKAEVARAEAQAREAEANAVVKFLEDKVFAAGRPKGQEGGLGHDVSLRDAIRASLPALGKSFVTQPLVEARLRYTLGHTFSSLGEHARAAEQFEQARALGTRHGGPDQPDTLRSMNSLASSYAALNRHAEALKLREEALAAQMRVAPPDHPDTLASMHSLADSYAALNRHAEALKLHEETLAARKRVLPPDHTDTLWSMNSLASSYAALNRHAEALKLREETLAARKRVLPPDHPYTLWSMYSLASSYAALNRHAEALKLHEETLAARKRVLPPDHTDTLASMHSLANSYAALNRHAEALKLHEETLAARKRALPPDHPDTLASMHSLANSYSALVRHAEALMLRDETLAARKRVLPPDHPDTLWSMANLASSYAALNRHAEALPLLDEVLAKANRPGVDLRLIPFANAVRLDCYQKLGDLTNCRATAEMLERRNPTDVFSLYNAACSRAVTASMQARAKEPDAARLAKEDADKAVAWLAKTIAAGWKDADHIKKDTDLDFLRDREDFKNLLSDLEAKSASAPQPKK